MAFEAGVTRASEFISTNPDACSATRATRATHFLISPHARARARIAVNRDLRRTRRTRRKLSGWYRSNTCSRVVQHACSRRKP